MPAKKAVAKKAPVKKKAAAKKAPGRKAGTPMSAEHKAALSSGRQSSRAVRAYLEALATNKPKRGRKRTPDSITARLRRIESELPSADPMAQLLMTQEQLDLTKELAALAQAQDLSVLEAEFVAHAATYASSKGISYTAFRAVGVPAEVLAAAGIKRGS